MTTQKALVKATLFEFAATGTVETQQVVDRVLEKDTAAHGGEVFHGSETPRNSVRRTLTHLQSDGLVIKDGKGYLKISISELVNTVVKGDVLDILKMIPDGQLNLAHSDPPWQYISRHLARGANTRMLGSGTSWFEMGDLPKAVIAEVYRALKPGGVFFVWMPPMQEESFDTWHTVFNDLYEAGFKLCRQVKWRKGKGPGYLWAADGEPCLVMFKAKRPKFYDLSVTDTIECPRLNSKTKTRYTDYTAEHEAAWKAIVEKYGSHKKALDAGATLPPTASHSCEKPVEMLMKLFTPVILGEHGEAPIEDRFLMDLYSGTGSASEAIHRLGGSFCAVELDHRNVEHLIIPRLGEKVRQVIDLTPQPVSIPATVTDSQGVGVDVGQ